MRRHRLGGAVVLLVLGLPFAVRAADPVPPTADSSTSSGFWSWLNPFARKKDDKPEIPPTVPVAGDLTPAPRPTAPAPRPTTAPITGPLVMKPKETPEQAFCRRFEVIERLKGIAEASHNEQLKQELEALESRNYLLFKAERPGATFDAPSQADLAILNDGGKNNNSGNRRDLQPPTRPKLDGQAVNQREDER